MMLPKNILVVGAGGREHALVRALLESPAKPVVQCAPGNAGIAEVARCHAVGAEDVGGLVKLAVELGVDFVVVGPEVPLSLGLADELRKKNIPVFGPGADGARLEASKVFTKEVLLKYGIPTAAAEFFTESAAACDYIARRGAPIVVKADGLAAGKGVVVAGSVEEGQAAAREMLDGGKFGEGGRRILVEDCLAGLETSILVLVSGKHYVILPTSQDHKRIGEGDTGPNTGGMGTCSPASIISEELLGRIEREIVGPSVEAIAAEGIDFRGTLFIGIMLTDKGPSVLEYNTRFGDPETQVVLPRLAEDLLPLLWDAARGSLSECRRARERAENAVCVVVAAKGYPDAYAKGDVIKLPPVLPEGTWVIHAGTSRNADGELVTAGGRVLGVVALGTDLREAQAKAYGVCEGIVCESKYYRRDIGAKLM